MKQHVTLTKQGKTVIYNVGEHRMNKIQAMYAIYQLTGQMTNGYLSGSDLIKSQLERCTERAPAYLCNQVFTQASMPPVLTAAEFARHGTMGLAVNRLRRENIMLRAKLNEIGEQV